MSKRHLLDAFKMSYDLILDFLLSEYFSQHVFWARKKNGVLWIEEYKLTVGWKVEYIYRYEDTADDGWA